MLQSILLSIVLVTPNKYEKKKLACRVMIRNDTGPLPKNEKLEKIRKYEEFIENKLKVQLQAVLDKRDEIYTKTSD